MAPVHRNGDVRRPGRGHETEPRPHRVVDRERLDPNVGRRRFAVHHHPSGRPLPHGSDQWVIGVEDRDAIGGQRLDELALGSCDGRLRAELPEVSLPHIEYDGDVGPRDPGEICDVTHAPCAVFEDEVTRGLVDLQHRHRQADLVVERAARGDRRTVTPQHCRDEVLGGRLARRSGDATDVDRRGASQQTTGEKPEGLLDIVDNDRWLVNRSRGERDRGTPPDRVADEAMTIDVLAGERDEDASG
jgi:hypothetical protein